MTNARSPQETETTPGATTRALPPAQRTATSARPGRRRRTPFALGVLLALLAGWTLFVQVADRAGSAADHVVELPGSGTIAFDRYEGVRANGPAVLLVHGSPATSASWGPLIDRRDELASGDLVALDRPGFGASAPPTESELEHQARAVTALADQLDLDRPILVGHSYGGPVALRAAADAPDRYAAVVLLAGACDPGMEDATTFRRLVDAAAWTMPDAWSTSNRELLHLGPGNERLRPHLDRVTCPVVVVHGTWDPVCPHDGTVDYLTNALENATEIRVRSLERFGHDVHRGRALDVVVEEIRRLGQRRGDC